MELVDGHDARLELRDALGVNVGADDIVPGLRETRTRYQANVTTTNYGELQGGSPENSTGDGPRSLDEIWNDYCDGFCRAVKAAIQDLVNERGTGTAPTVPQSLSFQSDFHVRVFPIAMRTLRGGR
jgi:hypothetical protein